MYNYDWDFSFLYPYTNAFIRGIGVTLFISLVSFIWGSIIGVIWGFILNGLPRSLQNIFLIINDAVRAVPILVLLFLVYYFPVTAIFGLSPINSLPASIIALGISQLAYTADIVRSAINNVSSKVILGAQALGLSNYNIRRYLIIPDILRQILPAQIAFFIGIIRLSSLAAIIGCQEVVFVARSATANNYRSAEAWILVGAIYIVLILPITIYLRYLEKTKWIKRRW